MMNLLMMSSLKFKHTFHGTLRDKNITWCQALSTLLPAATYSLRQWTWMEWNCVSGCSYFSVRS